MSARLLSFVIWAAVAASLTMWALRLMVHPAPAPAHAEVVGPAPVPAASLARLFGASPVEPQAAAGEAPQPVIQTQFKLIGVVAPRSGQRNGLALISADDRPARAVPVGGKVDDSLVVLSIQHRQVDIGPKGGPAAITLNLPAVAEASRGVPPALGARAPVATPGGPAGRMPVVMPPITPPTMPQPVAQPSQALQEAPQGSPVDAQRPGTPMPGMPTPGALQR